MLNGLRRLRINHSTRATVRPLRHRAPCGQRAISILQDAKVIFSGIQPTGRPHLGNHLGALKQWVELQDGAAEGDQLFFSIVDSHATTFPQDAEELRRSSWNTLAILLAVGLNPERCTIFFQSQVAAHDRLMGILNGLASTGYLERMTQWKVR